MEHHSASVCAFELSLSAITAKETECGIETSDI